MELNFRSFPYGSLPYESEQLCKQMILRLYENIPYFVELPLIDKKDNIINKTLDNIPSITMKDGKILLPECSSEQFLVALTKLDCAFNSDNPEDYTSYKANKTPFSDIYFAMLERIKPKFTIINLMGVFSLANSVFNRNASVLLTDKAYRKFLVQAVCVKALWFISQVKNVSPSTKPIILFEENLLYKFGTLKRTNDEINKDTVVTLFSKAFSRIQKAGGLVAVQCFEKCNWQLVFEAGNVNMISFNAYDNANNLHILAESVNRFLLKGGYINWGIVPVSSENSIRTLKFDTAYARIIDAIENLAKEGVSLDLLYKNATVSVQDNMANLPILFAEKALMIVNQISKKLPISSVANPD